MFEQCQGEFYQMNKCCSFRDGKCGEKTHKPLCERKKITDLLEMQRKRESHRFLIVQRVDDLNYIFI